MPSMDQEGAKSFDVSLLFSCFLHSNFSETEYGVTHTHARARARAHTRAHTHTHIYAHIKISMYVSVLE